MDIVNNSSIFGSNFAFLGMGQNGFAFKDRNGKVYKVSVVKGESRHAFTISLLTEYFINWKAFHSNINKLAFYDLYVINTSVRRFFIF